MNAFVPKVPVDLELMECEHPSELLERHFKRVQDRSPGYSLNAWSRKLGLSSSGVLVNILKRRRLPTEDLVEKLVASMKLGEIETEYFRFLVDLERADSPSAKAAIRRRAETFRFKASTETIRGSKFAAIAEPHHLVIREALMLKGARADFAWLRDRLRMEIGEPELRKALRNLVIAGLLVENEDGTYTETTRFYETEGEVPSEAVQRYHALSLETSRERLESVPRAERHFTSYVIAVKRDQIPAAKAAIEEFVNEFVARFASPRGEGEEVYQLHAQFVPHTRAKKDSDA